MTLDGIGILSKLQTVRSQEGVTCSATIGIITRHSKLRKINGATKHQLLLIFLAFGLNNTVSISVSASLNLKKADFGRGRGPPCAR
jgi:hypothetical protein